MPKVSFMPDKAVDCTLAVTGDHPASLSTIAWRVVGTDFDHDGNIDPGSASIGPTTSALKFAVGPGSALSGSILDIRVLYKFNPGSKVTSLTATLSQDGVDVLPASKLDITVATEPGPIVFRFWT